MFEGGGGLLSPGWIKDIAYVSVFMTLVIYAVEHEMLDVTFFHVLRRIVCWTSNFETVIAVFMIWVTRHMQIILSSRGYSCYMLYQLLCFLVPFVLLMVFYGIRVKMSLLNFIPYSVYVFVFWRFPSAICTGPLTDKFVVSLAMILQFLAGFPLSIVPLCCSIIGYICWTNDLLKLRRFL